MILIPHCHDIVCVLGAIHINTVLCLLKLPFFKMIFIAWITNDIHIDFNDIHWEGCLHVTRRSEYNSIQQFEIHHGNQYRKRKVNKKVR